MSFIINDKLLTEHKELRWFDWFNKDSKYRRMGTGYVPADKYFEFYRNSEKFIKIITLLTVNSGYYQLSNNIFIYLKSTDDDKIDFVVSNHLDGFECFKSILFNMCTIAHLWDLSLLDVFILTFWETKIIKDPYNNYLAPDNEVLYKHIISAINNDITYRDNGHWMHVNRNITNRQEALRRRLNHLQLECSKSNNITNKQYIELFRTFISTINLSIAINNKYTYIGSMHELIHYPITVNKFDTSVYDNIIDILCTTDNETQDEFITTLKEYNNRCNVTIRLTSLFFLLITNSNKLFGDSNYKKVKDLKKYYQNYIVSRNDYYTGKSLCSTQEKQEIKDVSIYNINKNSNNSNNTDIVTVNNNYFIKRDKFNSNYKRIYKCVSVINIIDACVMVDISSNKIPTQQYVLSESDCEYLGIEYQDGLEVFSNKLNWINIDNNK